MVTKGNSVLYEFKNYRELASSNPRNQLDPRQFYNWRGFFIFPSGHEPDESVSLVYLPAFGGTEDLLLESNGELLRPFIPNLTATEESSHVGEMGQFTTKTS
ncbi:MAG: hypothetical protein JWQ35_1614 [Bacteriovoracaceae bacterium]|nr:hypothetical protein [Bacteriovoracaceae bacterium]